MPKIVKVWRCALIKRKFTAKKWTCRCHLPGGCNGWGSGAVSQQGGCPYTSHYYSQIAHNRYLDIELSLVITSNPYYYHKHQCPSLVTCRIRIIVGTQMILAGITLASVHTEYACVTTNIVSLSCLRHGTGLTHTFQYPCMFLFPRSLLTSAKSSCTSATE